MNCCDVREVEDDDDDDADDDYDDDSGLKAQMQTLPLKDDNF